MTTAIPGAARRTRCGDPPADPVDSARAAGLRYVSDATPGIRRVRAGKGFRYVGPGGKPIRDDKTLSRIRSLAIPPAWADVWVCPAANGHLQATGRDARGRKQHRYHPEWRRTRDETKYHRMIAFARALPRLRRRVERDLALADLPRRKVLAAIVRLLEITLIRVGNEEYARDNHSFGLTTLRDRHAEIEGAHVCFHFRGKSGIKHEVDLTDRRLARIVQQCQDLPGQELFQWADHEGQVHDVNSADVNDYLRDIAGDEFTAKDFRTWAGTVLAARALQEFQSFDSQAQAKRNVVRAIESVARRLGNTRAVCRKCYVHPAVVEAYLDGSLLRTLRGRVEAEIKGSLRELRPEEAAVLAFLQERLKREAGRK
jgi:DNA topoisomerase-1